MLRIFISHSSRDTAPADVVKQSLADHGIRHVFLDFDKHAGILVGESWERRLYEELHRCEAVVLILTPAWHESKWCWTEFTHARSLGKRIFPIQMTAEAERVSPDLQHLEYAASPTDALEKLTADLRETVLGTRASLGVPQGRCPFPGLAAFDEEDAAFYFGRDAEVGRLLEELRARKWRGGERLLLVLGASGSGKSSLLRAGVIPQLRLAPAEWVVVPPFRPGTRPVDQLALALAVASGRESSVAALREELLGEDYAAAIERLASELRLGAEANECQILLCIDQGEELLRDVAPEQLVRFWEILAHALSGALPFLAVMTLRSDALAELQRSGSVPIERHHFLLDPIPLSRVAEIVQGPAGVLGIAVEPELVNALRADAQTDDALPLLAFTLRELFDHCSEDGLITVEAYTALGDPASGVSPLDNAVREAAERVLRTAQPNAEELAALRAAFVPGLVRVNAEGEYVRRVAEYDRLPSLAQPLIDAFVDARLLVSRGGEYGREVEVAHEALMRTWPMLGGWLAEDHAALVAIEGVRRSVREWEQAPPRSQRGLLVHRGERLAEVERITQATGFELFAAPEQAYLRACRREDTGQRRVRRLLAGTGVAVLVVISALASSWWQESARGDEQARLATARSWAAQAERAESPISKAVFGIQSVALADTLEGRRALGAGVAGLGRKLRALEFEGDADHIEFTSDGALMAAAGPLLMVWETVGWRRLATRPLVGSVSALVFSGDRRFLLVVYADGGLRVLDTVRWNEVWQVEAGAVFEHVAALPGAAVFYLIDKGGTLHSLDVAVGALEAVRKLNGTPLGLIRHGNENVRPSAHRTDSLLVVLQEVEDERMLAGCVHAFDVLTDRKVATWERLCGSEVTGLGSSGHRLLVGEWTDDASGNVWHFQLEVYSPDPIELFNDNEYVRASMGTDGRVWARGSGVDLGGCVFEVNEVGRNRRGMIYGPAGPCELAVNPSGEFVLSSNGELGIWRMEWEPGMRRLRSQAAAGQPPGTARQVGQRKIEAFIEANLTRDWRESWGAGARDDPNGRYAVIAPLGFGGADFDRPIEAAILDLSDMRIVRSVRTYAGERVPIVQDFSGDGAWAAMRDEAGIGFFLVPLRGGAEIQRPSVEWVGTGRIKQIRFDPADDRVMVIEAGDPETMSVFDVHTLRREARYDVVPGAYVSGTNGELLWAGIDAAGLIHTLNPRTGDTEVIARPGHVEHTEQILGIDLEARRVVSREWLPGYDVQLRIESRGASGRPSAEWVVGEGYERFELSRDFAWLEAVGPEESLFLPLTAEGLLDTACDRLVDSAAAAGEAFPPEVGSASVRTLCVGRSRPQPLRAGVPE